MSKAPHVTTTTLQEAPPPAPQGDQFATSHQPRLYDHCPFQEASQRQALVSGAEVGHEETKHNGICSQAWGKPVIGHLEDKPASHRIMRLFSNQKRCGDTSSSTATLVAEQTHGNAPPLATPQTWAGLSGLKVMGSFKKLRSSVFQGIHSREQAASANQQPEHRVSAANENGDYLELSNEQLLCNDIQRCNGVYNKGSLVDPFSSLSDEEEDDDEEGEEGLQRNSLFSRSIRRAYGAGRIALLDATPNTTSSTPIPRVPRSRAASPPPRQSSSSLSASRRPRPVSAVLADTNIRQLGDVTGGDLSRLSRSAENLQPVRAPFKRKTASAHLAIRPAPPLAPTLVTPPAEEAAPERLGRAEERGRSGSIKRATSASCMDVGERRSGRWRSPSGTRSQMQRLVGSLTDLTSRRLQMAPSSTPPPPLSALSQLHDDYSRRTPCVPPAERQRQRRPSPARARPTPDCEAGWQVTTASVEVTPSFHPAPLSFPELLQLSNAHVAMETKITPPQLPHHKAISQTPSPHTNVCCPDNRAARDCGTAEMKGSRGAVSHPSDEELQHNQAKCIWKAPEKDLEEQECCEDVSSRRNTSESSRLLATTALVDVPDSAPNQDSAPRNTDVTSFPTFPTTPNTVEPPPTSVPVIRRRPGRPRPRPISDYAQLISRKFSIPEERKAEPASPLETSAAISTATSTCAQVNGSEVVERGVDKGCHRNGLQDVTRGRPVSLCSSPNPEDHEDLDSLPSPAPRTPIPGHQGSVYGGTVCVSARLRPCVFSQSTPIGLDRLGRHKLHRILSDGVSERFSVLDDSVSEEDGSFDEIPEATPHLQSGVELSALNKLLSGGQVVWAEAVWDHMTMGAEGELAFTASDVIQVMEASCPDWWFGRIADREGWFPSCFVRVRVNQEEWSGGSVESVETDPDRDQEACEAMTSVAAVLLPRDKRAQSTEHREQMRTNVVREIMSTERDYIKHLRDICDGYIRQCRKHPGMFTEAQLGTIFSNIEDIYRFHRKFLKDLEKNYNKEEPHLSDIGSCFLQQGDGFSIYSEYCNTHPAACVELQRLMKQGRYKHFFEACRLLQQMIDISLAGFLLTPVQKICKYPLQLAELLKYTPKDHSDYHGVSDAYEAMKNVASLINERKRRLESVDTIAQWQVSILRWEGEDVLVRSSELIHSGELTRQVRPGKTQQRCFFLFDHQLVFCKKDVLRRDLLYYRGRLDMDATRLHDLPDGRSADMGGVTLRNAFRLHDVSTGNSLTLCCRKAQDKQRWLEAFACERRRIQEDQEMGMEISLERRKQALINAQRAKQGKIKSMGYSGHPVSAQFQPLQPILQRHVTVPTSLPQQQVFALAEPKRKPAHVWYNLTRHALFRK